MRRPTTTSSLNEAQAGYVIIDPALRDAGWNLDDRTQVGFEIPVDGYAVLGTGPEVSPHILIANQFVAE